MLLLAAAAAASLATQEPAQPITLGHTYQLEALDEDRAINVIVPDGYNEDEETRYPVIYVLDGGRAQDLMLVTGLERWNQLWSRSRPAIIVGIETKDRQRELLPPTEDEAEIERYPTAGEAVAFRAWIAQTVIPMIDAGYRTDGTTILAGESAAGHFVLETWLLTPDAFSGYAAISPSLQWNGEALSRSVSGPVANRPPLYISLADEGGATETGMIRLLDTLSPEQPYCFSDRRSDLVHANALHGLVPEALQYLLSTGVNWHGEYGLGLRCERMGAEEEQ